MRQPAKHCGEMQVRTRVLKDGAATTVVSCFETHQHEALSFLQGLDRLLHKSDPTFLVGR
jgi:hypothetical protein